MRKLSLRGWQDGWAMLQNWKCLGSCCHARLKKLSVSCMNILAAYCLFIHLFCSGLQKLACRHVLFLPSPFFLFVVTGIGALCRLTADMPWSDRPGPGSAGGQSSGFVRDSWPLGSLSVSGGTSHAMQCAVRNLKCNRGLLADLMYIRGRLWDGNQKELWLLMTGCRMCYGKPCCGFYSGTPVDIFERVIVGNHSISLWRRSNFQIQCSIQLKKERETSHSATSASPKWPIFFPWVL